MSVPRSAVQVQERVRVVCVRALVFRMFRYVYNKIPTCSRCHLLRRAAARVATGALVERHRDDHAVAGAYPEAARADQQGGDPDKGEAQLPGAQHLAHVRLDVHVLEVLVRVRMVQAESGVHLD